LYLFLVAMLGCCDMHACTCMQGHDDLGRPLLERALVIQEAALGPDHPDVQAIRDVLLGDDTEEEP
jgi:centrosomal protein CEP104